MNFGSPSPASPDPSPPGPRGRRHALRLAAIWAGLSVLGALAVVPYALSLLPESARAKLPPLPVILAISGLQTGAFACVLAIAGTYAGHALGLGSPLMLAIAEGRRPRPPRSLVGAALIGAVTALALAGMDELIRPYMPPFSGAVPPRLSPWSGLLASLYGGITEEVLMRLGLVSVIAWLASRILGASGRGRAFALGIGVVTAALLFGAGHLPAAAKVWPLDGVVVARTLLLNALIGLVAGVQYVRRGFEHAVAAHFSADIVLHVLVPALVG